MDTPSNASENQPSKPDQPSGPPSNGPAPDSPFNTSPSEGFEGPSPGFPSSAGQPEGSTAGGGNPFDAPPMSVSENWSTVTIPASIAVDMARDWVRERQTATLLGTFAAGVFVGVLSR